jgi:DNA primase
MLLDFKANMKRGTEKKGKRGDFSVYINRQKQQKQKKHVTDAQEAALFSLLWNDPAKRRGLDEEHIFPLIKDVRLKNLIAALLNGESPEELEERWLKSGDRFPLEALALGNAFCQQFDEGVDIFDVISSSLKTKAMKSRYNVLYSKMLKGEATREEIEEMQKIASALKGGREDK